MSTFKDNEKIQQLTGWFKENRIRIMTVSAVTATALVSIGVWVNATKDNAYVVAVNGQTLGVVADKVKVEESLNQLMLDRKEEKGTDIAIREEITVEPVHSKVSEMLPEEEAAEMIAQSLTYEVEACAISVEGEQKVIVRNKEEAEAVLTAIALTQLKEGSEVALKSLPVEESVVEKALAPTSVVQPMSAPTTVASEEEVEETQKAEVLVIAEGLKCETVTEKVMVADVAQAASESAEEAQKVARSLENFDFQESIYVTTTYVEEEEIMSVEDALAVLLSQTEKAEEYILQSGDNIWDIAMKYNTTMEHILEINPQIIDEKRMQIGDVIKLEVPTPLVSMLSVEEATFKELIPAEIEYISDDSLYKDETKEKEAGKDGLKEITVLVSKVNGKEVSRELLNENILEEPSTKVILHGTKERPANGAGGSVKATGGGSFMHPLNGGGRLTSAYGSRNSSFHRGVDIAAPAGTPIYAAAAGTVVYSGYNNGGFGKLIIIDHQNGYQTYYAHCSSLYVGVGTKVSKGQNIAGVGNTGNSSGNHVHFEIRKNGSPINPGNFIF